MNNFTLFVTDQNSKHAYILLILLHYQNKDAEEHVTE